MPSDPTGHRRPCRPAWLTAVAAAAGLVVAFTASAARAEDPPTDAEPDLAIPDLPAEEALPPAEMDDPPPPPTDAEPPSHPRPRADGDDGPGQNDLPPPAPVADPSLRLRDADAAWLERYLKEHALEGGYLALAPTARWASKCWPPARFGEVAARVLDARPMWKALVLCSPSERDQARPALDALARHGLTQGGPDPRVVTPQTDVGQLAALLARCDLFLGNDSAPLHIAVGFNRPIVSVFGPTDPAVVGP